MDSQLRASLEESVRELDDRQVIGLLDHPKCGEVAQSELRHRLSFESEWSGDLPPPRGRVDGMAFMSSLTNHTLCGMARGRAGEPSYVVAQAKSILQSRKSGTGNYPISVKTPEDRRLFDSLMHRAHASFGSRSERHAAILRLQNIFGYNYHKENRR